MTSNWFHAHEWYNRAGAIEVTWPMFSAFRPRLNIRRTGKAVSADVSAGSSLYFGIVLYRRWSYE